MNTWLDPIIIEYEKQFGRPKRPVVWEVGSRDGRDGVELAERLGGSQADTVLVEANPEQAEVIRRSYPQARVYGFAAYNKVGVAQFVVYGGNEGAIGSSSLNLGWKDGDGLESRIVWVPTLRLDSVLGEDEVDVMKIDVEGKSLEVLKGLGKRLRQVRVYHIETEEWSGSDKAVARLMRARGYRLAHVSVQYDQMPDQVWVRRED